MTNPESDEDLELSRLLDEALSELRRGRAINPAPLQILYPTIAPNLLGLLDTLRELDSAAQGWRLFDSAATTSLTPNSDPSVETPSPATVGDQPPQRED